MERPASMRGRGGFMRGRGGFATRGRQTNVAVSRTAFVRQDQTNSARRLQKDYKELTDPNRVPLVGISAAPLPNQMYTWHGNIRGPEGTKFSKGVWHFEMQIPQDYPCSPPTITLYTPLPHPNMVGTTLCMDMLTPNNKGIYQGWVSAYTIEAILINLQSYLFIAGEDDDEDETTKKLKSKEIKDAIKAANEYQSPVCPHKGPLQPWPPFQTSLNNPDLKNLNENEQAELKSFYMIKTPEQLLREELVCFQTKMSLREATLGIGISLRKSARTGQVAHVNPIMDLMSMRAFTKLNVRKGLDGVKFTHWFPLYFGEKEKYEIEKDGGYDEASGEMLKTTQQVDTFERFETHFKKSFAFISNGNSNKGYNHESVYEIMPKLLMTHIVDMMKENRHVSMIAIRRLFNFIRIFLYLSDQDPKIQEMINEQLESFINHPDKRIKEHTTNLGNILVFATLSNKYRYSDIMKAYLEEQLDRQVFWMLKEIPELDFENKKLQNKGKVDEKERIKVCFECGKTGFMLNMFFKHLNDSIEQITGQPKAMSKLTEALDSNSGCLNRDIENNFQKLQQKTLRCESFEEYYSTLGVPVSGEKEVYEALVKAIKNSRQKGYHGECENIDAKTVKDANEMEIDGEQSQQRVFDLLEQFTDLKLSVKNGEPHQIDSPSIRKNVTSIKLKDTFNGPNAEEMWKNLCIKNFEFILQEFESNKFDNINPSGLAAKSDFNETNFKKLNDKKFLTTVEDKLGCQLRQYRQDDVDQSMEFYSDKTEYEGYTYRKLFLKLSFEKILYDLQHNHNFEILYEFLKSFGDELDSVIIKIIHKSSLKSNHYWLMAIIPKLKNLKTLIISRNITSNPFNEDGFNFLQKGLSYFQKNGGKLDKLQFNQVFAQRSGDYLYPTLKCLPDLQIINFKNNLLTNEDCKAIGKVLSDFKNIRELDLSNTGISVQHSKEIADGLMRAKQLEIIKLRDNAYLDCNQIIYNLAFSPKIHHIDISNCSKANGAIESLYKLLKISGSIRTLLCGNTTMVASISKQFCEALGENKTLEHLNIDQVQGANPNLSSTIQSYIAKGIAMNQYKNGSLNHLSMMFCLPVNSVQPFLNGMYISDKDHEEWYGDNKIAQNMSHDQLDKKLNCGLKYLNIRGSKITDTGFRMKNYENLNTPQWPKLIELLAKTNIQALGLGSCSIDQKAIELFSCAIGKNPVSACSNLKILNLSRNNINLDGSKLLAAGLKNNSSIEFLDLSQNQLKVFGTMQIAESLHQNTTLKGLNLFKNTIDVDGARAIRELLEANSTIEFIDLGHNRIRSKGLEAIKEGILANSTSKIHSLGLRMNFINDDGFQSFFDDVIFDNYSKKKVRFYPANVNELLQDSKETATLKRSNSLIDKSLEQVQSDMLTGTESFGDRKDKRNPWASKFDDLEFTHFVVESQDKNKSYCKEYTKETLLGKRNSDELLNDFAKISKNGGVAVYIKNKVQKRQIRNLYINENNLTQYKAKKIYEDLKGDDNQLYVDSFEKISHFRDEKLKRTLWFGPIPEGYSTTSRHTILETLQQNRNGLVKDVRVKVGKKVAGKTNAKSVYMFVEFEHEENVNRASKMVYKGRIHFSRKAYLCGTQTYNQIRKSKRN